MYIKGFQGNSSTPPPPQKKIINQNMISKHHVSFIFRGVYGVHSVYFFVLEMGLVIKN